MTTDIDEIVRECQLYPPSHIANKAGVLLEWLKAELAARDKTIYLDALNYAHLLDRAEAAEKERDKLQAKVDAFWLLPRTKS